MPLPGSFDISITSLLELNHCSRAAWSKHWHAGHMRPGDRFCAVGERFLYPVYFTKS